MGKLRLGEGEHLMNRSQGRRWVVCRLEREDGANEARSRVVWEGLGRGLLLNLDGGCHMTQDTYAMAPF